MQSVKNFILQTSSKAIKSEKKENDSVQFGRVHDHIFALDVMFPFSPLQAFAICLSSIDNKLGCQ